MEIDEMSEAGSSCKSFNLGTQDMFSQNSLTNNIFANDIDQSAKFDCISQPFEVNSLSLELPMSLDTSTSIQNIASPMSTSSNNVKLAENTTANSMLQNVPESIINLKLQFDSSGLTDSAFVYAISAQMCQELCPMDCYVNLKMGLLLSIASIQTNSSIQPFSVIVIGRDSSTANLIMNNIGNYAQRFLLPLDDFSGATIKENNFIEAGPLILAQDGVCFIGDWSRVKPNAINAIQKVIDSGKILLDNKTAITYPLECAIWSQWSCSNNVTKNTRAVATFVNVFGIPIVLEENLSNSIVDYLLEEAINGPFDTPDDGLNVAYDEMRQYLNIVRNIDVKMSTEMANILGYYFIATRMDRKNVLTQRAFVILRQLAESHAKLSLRNEVLICDVLAAILITEKFINELFGPSLILPSPIQTAAVKHVQEVDEFMKIFNKWVHEYIDMFIGVDIRHQNNN